MKPVRTQLQVDRKGGVNRWLLLSVVSLVTLLACAGCKQNGSSKIADDRVGTYALVSVDGKKVPCTVQHEGHAVPIQSGTFTINADGTCSSKMLISGQNSAMEVKATYTQEGSKLTMRWAGAGTTAGSVKGDTFTMTNEGMIFAYHIQKNTSY